MQTYKLTGKNDVLTGLAVLTLTLFLAHPVFGVTLTNESLKVEVGDTFSIERPVKSSFHRWELDQYDVRKLSLVSKNPPDTIGYYSYTFKTLAPGDVDIEFVSHLETSLGAEKRAIHTVELTVVKDLSVDTGAAGKSSREQSKIPSLESIRQESEPKQDQNTIDRVTWGQVKELIQTQHYESARNIIDTQVRKSSGRPKQRWMDLKAKSFEDEGEYGRAIGVWKQMIDQFDQGPKSEWLYSIAQAHIKNEDRSSAEQALIQIRHEYPGSPQWIDAMVKLSDFALEDDNEQRAKSILEAAQSEIEERLESVQEKDRSNQSPKLFYKLARLYDQYPSIRNLDKAVKFYRRAASAFDPSDTRSRTAAQRADYLSDNFLNFGTE